MARQCASSKQDEAPCTATVDPPHTYCWWHDPANADQRRRAASKAGRRRHKSTAQAVDAVLEELSEVVALVRRGDIERGGASVIAQLLNAKLRGLETRMRAREHEEWAEWLEALEARAAEQR